MRRSCVAVALVALAAQAHVGHVMLSEVSAAYLDARRDARTFGTARLRMSERRLRRRIGRLTQPEVAYLSGLRDELRDRGVVLPEMPVR